MVLVMAASALTVAGLATATTVAGASATQMTLTASNYAPIVNQPVTFKATLTSGGKAIPERITIYHYLNGKRYNDITAYSTLTFAVKFTTPGIRMYYATFAGNGAYKASTSSKVTVTVRVATSLNVYVPPVWYGYGLIPSPEESAVTQGQPYAVVEYAIHAADGTWPCGAANFYIDGQAAGGSLTINHAPLNDVSFGCPAGSSGGSGELILHSADIAALSVGTHTLLIKYPGNSRYAPSQFTAQFVVVAS